MKEEKRSTYIWIFIIIFNVILYLKFALLHVAAGVAVRNALFHPATNTLLWLGAALLCSVIEGIALTLSSKSRNALFVTIGAVGIGLTPLVIPALYQSDIHDPFFILGVFLILGIACAYIGEALVIYFVARQIQKNPPRFAQGLLIVGAVSILVFTGIFLVNARRQSITINDALASPVTAHLVPEFDSGYAQYLKWIKIENKYLGFSFFYYHAWKLDKNGTYTDGGAPKETGYNYISYNPNLGADGDEYGVFDADFTGSRYVCAKNPDYAKASLVTLGSSEVRAKRLVKSKEILEKKLIWEEYFIDLPKGGCLSFDFSVDPKKDKDGVYLEFFRSVVATVQFE